MSRRGYQQRQNPYTSHWPTHTVTSKLQNGQLVCGSIRMFPSSNDEANVSLSDGTDILITTMNDRNRAFHGDEVAVEIYPEDQWRVTIEDFTAFCKKQLGAGFTDDRMRRLQTLTQPKASNQQRPGTSNNRQSQPLRHVPIAEVMQIGDRDLVSFIRNREPNCDFVQQTGKVVYILKKLHPRAVVGFIKPMGENTKFALIQPLDRRVPAVKVQVNQCPPGFLRDPSRFRNSMYRTDVPNWAESDFLPMGSGVSLVGRVGELKAETLCITLKHGVQDRDFPEHIKAPFQNWTVPASEVSSRRDLREMCIFTMDSKVTDDMDDAMSIEEVEPGIYQVGVHIADVSYFIVENSELDKIARERAVTVYLENKIIHMLPEELSEDVCSLNAGKDRLCFSILWKMNQAGEILDEWIGKTVIRSCVSLTYDMAINLMENSNTGAGSTEIPSIHGPFTLKDIARRIKDMNQIAVNLRNKRIQDGALFIEAKEILFILNEQTGKPTGYKSDSRDKFLLVQEFMVQANKSVAQKLVSTFPDKAILRVQPEPRKAALDKLVELCRCLGISLSISTPAEIQRSLNEFVGSDEVSSAKWLALSKLLMKCFQKSKLVCGKTAPGVSTYHYTMNSNCYTDFTSPIRRYSDVLVHRLLAASVGHQGQPMLSVEEQQEALDHYSRKNTNANSADSDSVDLFLAYLIQERGQLQERGIVINVSDKSFEVLLLNLNITRRVYLSDLPLNANTFSKENNCPELSIEWQADGRITRHRIAILSLVDCTLTRKDELFRWSFLIERPMEEL